MKPTEIESDHIAARDKIPPALCPSCQRPLFQSFDVSEPTFAHVLFCVHKDCGSPIAQNGAKGTSFEAAAKALRKAVEKEGK